jgi:hypothetical protein
MTGQRKSRVLITFLLLTLPVLVGAFSSFFTASNKESGKNGSWEDDLERLANSDQFVAGYFVNFDDVRFFRGTADDLSKFLVTYASLKSATTSSLQLHHEPGKVTYFYMSPQEHGMKDDSCDWKLVVENARIRAQLGHKQMPLETTYTATVHVYTGGNLKWEDVKIPPGLSSTDASDETTVTAKSRN